MRNWAMTLLPLVLVTGCNGTASDAGQQDGKSESGPPANVGPIISQNFALTGFAAVELAGPDDVTIRQGDRFAITARGSKDALDRLEIKLDGDRLVIGRKLDGISFGSRKDDDVDIAITMPALHAARLTGSGSIDADTVAGDAVEAIVTGSGDLKIAKLNGKRAEIRVSGSGDIDIEGGTIGSGELGVTGSGDIDADGLVATTLDVSITGSGNVEAQATGKANVSILGSGDVKLGGGAICTTRKTGSGSVTCN